VRNPISELTRMSDFAGTFCQQRFDRLIFSPHNPSSPWPRMSDEAVGIQPSKSIAKSKKGKL
jgi:hypothetical protein